jgi:hypothetical protein
VDREERTGQIRQLASVGHIEKLEFGCLAWCEFASLLGIKLISEADLDLARFNWGFSEEYKQTPQRLMDGRDRAGYHLMVKNGEVGGGPFIPDECLELPGFHVAVEWALIAHSSYLPFNTVGQAERGKAQIRLRRELAAIGIGDGRWALEASVTRNSDKEPAAPEACRACGATDHQRALCPVWPPGIGESLAANADSKNGKWRLKRSPELEGFPESDWGVPILQDMDEEQRARFIGLLH